MERRTTPLLRLAVATIAAPLMAALVASVAVVILEEQLFHLPSVRLALVLGLVFGFIMGVPVSATLGLALHTMLVETKRTSAIAYAMAGAPAGVCTVLAMGLLDGRFYSWLLLPSCGAGALAGMCFWLIRRPDRDAAPNPPTSAP